MSESTEKQLVPHWIARLFGAKGARFLAVREGINITKDNGETFMVLASALGQGVQTRPGFFFTQLVLNTDKGEKVLGGLQKSHAQALFLWMRDHWYRHLAPAVSAQAAEIRKILTNGYLRTSRWQRVRQIAEQALTQFQIIPSETAVGESGYHDFELLHQLAHWTQQDLDAFREHYVERMIARHAVYFDTVESNPLTASQRRACVVDEDNNLVLAGAGTGKTSTMVGRAGFLIREQLVRPEHILMLAFAKKAADEMQERLDEKVAEKGIRTSTFHSLGKYIIAQVVGAQPAVSVFAEDEKRLTHQINQWFEDFMLQPLYKKKVIDYFANYLYPAANPFEFDSEGEYYDFIRANNIRTLKGEWVKGLTECYIANFLFKNGVEYQYEANYKVPTRSLDFRQYKPDFYLPEHDIYLEHVGIDRHGNTAPYVDRARYAAGMEWKRALHKKNRTVLVETFHYEFCEGTLFKGLSERLKAVGVRLNPLPDEAVLATLREFGAISEFAKLLADLLKRYKAIWLSPEALQAKIAPLKNSLQVRAALDILDPIFTAYQKVLQEASEIDFDDMIGKALDYVSSGRFRSPWRTILVDEFQDISDPRARLVNALKHAVPDCALFCVGDDWQAIYRFTGSDIRFTTGFEGAFGPTKITALDKTFRFNNSICDIASAFVLKNPAQVSKRLTTHEQVSRPAVSLLRAKQEDRRQPRQGEDRLEVIMKRIAELADPGSSVFLLARFGFVLPDYSQLGNLRAKYKELKIESMTMHASKGKEADYVVILGLEKGPYGFPSQKQTHPLLEALLPEAEVFPYAEERRLFYVAITRARKRAYLACDMTSPSEFVAEFLRDKYPIELNEFEITFAQRFAELIRCVLCKTGAMQPKKGTKGTFYGCSNFPLCNNAENGCTSCGSPMQHMGRFKVCVNPDCTSWVPTCPKCGGEMIKREGRFGEFWACKNYRGGEEVSCTHTENSIEYVKSK